MNFDEIVNEEGGTLKLENGQLVFNVTKQRQKDLRALGLESVRLENEKKKLEAEIEKDPIGKRYLEARVRLLEKRIEKLRKDKINIARGKRSEYTVGGNFVDKNDLRVDNYHVEDGDPNKVENWVSRMKAEKEISNKLNKQNTKRKFRPR